MMGNRALLKNFVEKFLETVRFSNNDFAVIAGYGDVVIGLPKMKFEKDHLCSACEQGKIHWKHHKSKTAIASNKPLYLLYMDLYKSMWSDQEKGVQKIDRLARSLLIQGLPNDIYSLIDSKNTAKDLWDALAKHMLGSEYGEQDRKAAVCMSMKDSEGSEADDFSELKKITALLAKAFNRRKFYSKPTKNNLRTSSSSQSANKKQEFVKTDTKKVEKKDDKKKRDMSRVKCYNCKKEGHFAKDCKKSKVKDYEYYKKKMMLTKKDKDKQVLLAEDQAWMESSGDSDQEINANMVFMAQIEKVLSDSEASLSSADEKISE
nr:hypothetical protein [Tanacetum cinerariifolium]